LAEKEYAVGQSGDTFSTGTRTFFAFNGADRGAKISITNSIFKHSRFCKGMIIYRPSPYISNDGIRTLLNETNLYMTKPLKNDTDAYIIIKSSTFTNMNAYT
jgi:hypothetical protein